MSTRREFLLNCSAFAAAAALVPAPALAGTSRLGPGEIGLDQITAAAFAMQLNTRFVVRGFGDRDVALLLAAIEPTDSRADAKSPASVESQERFSLFFAGADSLPLGQNTYSFQHASLGRFEMFIVPIGRPVSGCRVYEAVFDRPSPATRGRKRSPDRNATQ